jgi:hypothetical protein
MDSKLKFKPIELLDIGIDKLTKIPIPILNDNIISTFDMENGVPTDSFILTYDASSGYTFQMTLTSSDTILLSLDYGDGSTGSFLISTGGTPVTHTYLSAITYTITASGWLEKITNFICLNGITHVEINNIKKLNYLDLSNNHLTKLNLDGMIYLNFINLEDNYLSNDEVDDIYIVADTFLTFAGYINTVGTNNGKPSVYSEASREDLDLNKNWTLSYNS